MNETEKYAQRITDRAVRDMPCGFDPVTIFTIVCSLLGLLMNCWHFWHANQSVSEVCADTCVKNRLIRSAARQYRKHSRVYLSRDAAEKLARATVEEAIGIPHAELVAYQSRLQPPTNEEIKSFNMGIEENGE